QAVMTRIAMARPAESSIARCTPARRASSTASCAKSDTSCRLSENRCPSSWPRPGSRGRAAARGGGRTAATLRSAPARDLAEEIACGERDAERHEGVVLDIVARRLDVIVLHREQLFALVAEALGDLRGGLRRPVDR